MAIKTLVTTFDDPREAERAVHKLHEDGFTGEDVGWVVRAADGREIAHGNLLQEKRKVSAVEGAAVGGALGGLSGLVIGLTALAIPGVGPVVGPLISALVGIALGAGAGALVDAFVREPITAARPEAHRYAERIGARAGVVMVTVYDEDEEERALEILRGEASLHSHPFRWRVPALTDEGRPSSQSVV